MWTELIFPDEESASLSNFGIYHLSIDDAVIFVTKCLWANNDLEIADFDYYDKEFDDQEMVTLFRSEILTYKNLVLKGINSGKLQASLLKRDLDENIITNKTFLDVPVLTEFLSERSIEIQGDMFSHFAEDQSKLLDLAVTAIRYGLRKNNEQTDQSTKDHILYLEQEIKDLKEHIRSNDPDETAKPEKPLHTKERETLLKLIIGMAVDGYGYDPSASRSPIPRELADSLSGKDLPLDQDTVRKWLKEASALLPSNHLPTENE